ncbi:MAG TPA: glycosyltransferase family 4 protein [Acidimicrobiales bacterium]|nr:glycosyltransferase family 4 protein [Acidimicrobiales bacterium]
MLSVQPVAERGGSDQALLRLARQLRQGGWQVHIALPAPSPMAPEFEAVGAVLHVVPMQRISTSHGAKAWLAYVVRWPRSVFFLWRLTRQLKPDVVHTNSLHSWYAWAAAWLARKPHVWHAREIVVQSRSALAVERFLAVHFARRVIAISEAVASQLDPRNVIVAREEADPAEFFPGRAGQGRASLGLPDEALLVGYVGRIDTWKGVDVLLGSLPLLQHERPGDDVRLVIAGGTVAGKEDYASSLRLRAAELGCLWLGPLPGPTAGDLIADLDCLVLPSTEPEPWGLVLVEALACGTPAVATDAGGAREILADVPAGGGLLVPPRDPASLASAVAKLLPSTTSSELRRRRPVLRARDPAPYAQIFGELVEETGPVGPERPK